MTKQNETHSKRRWFVFGYFFPEGSGRPVMHEPAVFLFHGERPMGTYHLQANTAAMLTLILSAGACLAVVWAVSADCNRYWRNYRRKPLRFKPKTLDVPELQADCVKRPMPRWNERGV